MHEHGQPTTVSIVVPTDTRPDTCLAVYHFVLNDRDAELTAFEVISAELPTLDEKKLNVWLNEWIYERCRLLPPPRTAPAGGLTARALRGIRFGTPLAIARAEIESYESNAAALTMIGLVGRQWPERTTRRRGRPGKPDLYYAKLAADYHRLVNVEGSTRPVQILARQRRLPESVISRQLYTARERGLLSSRGRGHVAGQLSPRARAILQRGT